MSEPPKKRRNRLTVVCRRCRKKKAKCDKLLPCNQCVKAHCPAECRYDLPSVFRPGDAPKSGVSPPRPGPPDPASLGAGVRRNSHPVPLLSLLRGPPRDLGHIHGHSEDLALRSHYGDSLGVHAQMEQPTRPSQQPQIQPENPQPHHVQPSHQIQPQNLQAHIQPQPNSHHSSRFLTPQRLRSFQLPSNLPRYAQPQASNPDIHLRNAVHLALAVRSRFRLLDPYDAASARPSESLLGVHPMVPSKDLLNIHMNLLRDLTDLLLPFVPGSRSFYEPRYFHVYNNFKLSLRPSYILEISQLLPAVRLYWQQNLLKPLLKLMTIQNIAPDSRTAVVKAASRHFGPMFISSNRITSTAARHQLSLYGDSLGCTFTPNYNEADHYQINLKRVLPPLMVFLAYLRQFFRKIYPVYPILDETWLFDQVRRLLVFSSTDGSFQHANLAEKSDFTVMAIVLFMLRLLYLSFLTNIKATNDVILDSVFIGGKSLRECPISLNALDLAQKLLHSGSYHSRPLFTLLQANLLKLIYRLHSSKNEIAFSDFKGDSGLGSIISLAVSQLLERDPDYIVNMPDDKKMRNLRRKIWYTVVQMDYYLSLVFCSPRCIAKNSFNTKLPEFCPDSSNVTDIQLEQKTIELLLEVHEVMTAGSPLLDIWLDMQLSFEAVDVIRQLNDFELFVEEKLGKVSDYFNPDSKDAHEVLAVVKLRALLVLQMFLGYFYYFFHCYYKAKANRELNFFYLKKLTEMNYTESSYLCCELMLTGERYFDKVFFLMATPLILLQCQMIAMIGTTIAININCRRIIKAVEDGEQSDLLDTIAYKNGNFLIQSQKLTKLLGERYFFGWKSSKIHGHAFDLIYSEDMYMVGLDILKESSMDWSEEQLIELLSHIPTSPLIKVDDNHTLLQHCYYSLPTLDDAALEGADLYKSIQTDNFWITLNTSVDREPAHQILMFSEDSSPSSTHTPGSERRGSELTKGGNPENGSPAYVSGQNRNVTPNPLEIDLSLFGADWSMDDGFPSQNIL